MDNIVSFEEENKNKKSMGIDYQALKDDEEILNQRDIQAHQQEIQEYIDYFTPKKKEADNGMYQNEPKYDRFKQQAIMSIGTYPVKRVINTKKEKKEKGFKKILIITTALIIGSSLIIGIPKAAQMYQDNQKYNAGVEQFADLENEALVFGDYPGYGTEVPWWYDTTTAAQNILNEKNYDIDSTIYGMFANLRDYNKYDHMDKIFEKLNSMVNMNPDMYDEETIRACTNPNFANYVLSLGFENIEDYDSYMKNIFVLYGDESMDQAEKEFKIKELLDGLKGGAR